MVESDILIPAFHAKYGWIEQVLNCETKRTKYTKNEIRVYESGICEIDVYDSYGSKRDTAIFSSMDLSLIKKYKWYKDNVGYLSTTIDGKKVRLHRLIYPNQITDHYDNNKLNNTRGNLQKISHSENIAKIKNHMYNPQGVTGIYLTPSNTWQSTIMINSHRHTKNFKTRDEAILMRYIWELNYWGKNAPQLDDIKEQYPRLVTAAERGLKISETPKLVIAILNKLSLDEHCPCRLEKTKDTKCMCKEFQEMTEGMCHCGLFIKEKDNE